MEKNTKSKFTVIGFVVFVLAIYGGSYIYTKNNNERLMSAPRLVLLVGVEEQVNKEFQSLDIDGRRTRIRSMSRLGLIYSVSQTDFDAGVTDIAKQFKENNIGDQYVVADCMTYSEKIKRTMAKVSKSALKSSWIFSACGIIE